MAFGAGVDRVSTRVACSKDGGVATIGAGPTGAGDAATIGAGPVAFAATGGRSTANCANADVAVATRLTNPVPKRIERDMADSPR